MRVLITGAAGTIGRDLRAGLRGRHELLRLLDVAEQEPAGAGEEVVTADVADGAAMGEAAEGMDAIVHLGANPDDAPFDVILEPNIVGTQRVFEAALAAGVPRVVYASSHRRRGRARAARPHAGARRRPLRGPPARPGLRRLGRTRQRVAVEHAPDLLRRDDRHALAGAEAAAHAGARQ